MSHATCHVTYATCHVAFWARRHVLLQILERIFVRFDPVMQPHNFRFRVTRFLDALRDSAQPQRVYAPRESLAIGTASCLLR
jgi:hypothetical protein